MQVLLCCPGVGAQPIPDTPSHLSCPEGGRRQHHEVRHLHLHQPRRRLRQPVKGSLEGGRLPRGGGGRSPPQPGGQHRPRAHPPVLLGRGQREPDGSGAAGFVHMTELHGRRWAAEREGGSCPAHGPRNRLALQPCSVPGWGGGRGSGSPCDSMALFVVLFYINISVCGVLVPGSARRGGSSSAGVYLSQFK